MRGLFGNVGAIYGRGPDSVKDGVLDYQDVRLGMPSLRGSPERVQHRPRCGRFCAAASLPDTGNRVATALISQTKACAKRFAICERHCVKAWYGSIGQRLT